METTKTIELASQISAVSCPTAVLSAPRVVRHRVAPLTVRTTAYGPAIQGTTVSTAMAIAQTKATALLPISDVAVADGFGGLAGIRSESWSPPV